jgi:hypothetical protein
MTIQELWRELKISKQEVKSAKNKYKGFLALIRICKKYNFELTRDGYDTLIVKGFKIK